MTISRLPQQRWILASASPRRRKILSSLGLRFSVEPSSIPEPCSAGNRDPRRYAVALARAKALDVGSRYRSGIIIGADTVVAAGELILGKPAGAEDAKRMLRRLSGRWHEVITGICLHDSGNRKGCCSHSRSRVHFRHLSEAEMDWYLRTGEYRDKAGGYGIQGYASLFVDKIEGCYFNVVGFPVVTFYNLCKRLDIRLMDSLFGKRG